MALGLRAAAFGAREPGGQSDLALRDDGGAMSDRGGLIEALRSDREQNECRCRQCHGRHGYPGHERGEELVVAAMA